MYLRIANIVRIKVRRLRKGMVVDMSKKMTDNTGEKQEKVLTKYDQKMQRRQEERKRAKRDELVGRIAGIVIVAALFCLVASFPIRSYLTINGTFIEVAGEKVSRVEFDYNYNLVKNRFINENSYYLSMFGIDLSGDLSMQMYSDTLTYQDYFEQLAVESIADNKALRDQMRAAGFTYDTAEEYAKYEETLKEAASAAGMTEKEYLKQAYGAYATPSRLKGYITESIEIGAYYEQLAEEKKPSAAEIQSYYEERKADYDSVDYRMITINAELPTEPTELADPAEETEGADTGETYQPSDAEIEAAMQEAHTKAEAALGTVSEMGELHENVEKGGIFSLLQDWLFEDGRQAGDTTIIENENSHLYYVAEFVDRYLDQTSTVDARIIIVGADAAVGADAMLEEWKAGEATEDGFADLADKYGSSTEGGLYEGLAPGGMADALADWLFDSARAGGETTVIPGGEGESSYVVYYVGTNQPEWYLNIEATLLTERLEAYMEEIGEGYDVTDAKGNLNYLKIQEAAANESGSAEEPDVSGEGGSGTEPDASGTEPDPSDSAEGAE